MKVGATQLGQKVFIACTVDDCMEKFLLGGAGMPHLWCNSLEICHQICINDKKKLEGKVGFEFIFAYKSRKLTNIRTLFFP